jgi:hypothetical protein
MTETQLIIQLRLNIKAALETVTPDNAPTIYKLIQTEHGYENVEQMIINKMIQNDFSASACIPHLEREL